MSAALMLAGLAMPRPVLPDAQMQAYLQAGGALSDLCTEMGESMADGGHCPACHLAVPADLPGAPLTVRAADLIFVLAVVAPRESRAVRRTLDPAHAMRAPPLA